MRAEIISIGTEILIGSTLDTNSCFLSQKLAENAVDVYHHHTVGDNIERISRAFSTASENADLVISTGGLGPTEDDATVRGLALFLGRPLRLHVPTRSYILKRLKERGFARITRLVEKQCYVPEDCRFIFQNRFGTAPGLLFDLTRQGRRRIVVVLPGPPREMKPMMVTQVVPALKKLGCLPPHSFVVRTVKVASAAESQVAQKVNDLLQLKPPVTVGIYAKPGSVELKIMAKAENPSQARRLIAPIEKKIRKKLGAKVYGTDADTLSSVIGGLLVTRGLTLSVAESCTGGLLANRITQSAGSSQYFYGGIIAYDDRVKTGLLGVPSKLLKSHGAVSLACATTMARNVRKVFETDLGISITGIAGPGGGSRNKPVGLVYIGLADERRASGKVYRFFGNRQEIQSRAADTAMDLLRLRLAGKKR